LGININTNEKVALKIYEKEKMKEISRQKSIRREIKIMLKINHPNICRLYEVIETTT
jgi:MAP/microtubule affinity-regulating kinase